MNLSKLARAAVVALMLATVPVGANSQADKKKSAHAEDIMDHRTMAEAHRKAAECLEAGRSEKDCHEQLRKDCRGVGIGKTCGMKHKH